MGVEIHWKVVCIIKKVVCWVVMSVASMRCILLLTVLVVVRATAVTKENLAELAGERAVFLKLYAPWCGHCKAMAPAWEALMKDYTDSETLFVAECDCTEECKDLCSHVGVQGYPSIKYGSVEALEDYKGGRDLEALKTHAASIRLPCSPKKRELCSEQDIEQLDELLEKSKAEVEQLIAEQEAVIAGAESEFKAAVAQLQESYTGLMKAKEEKIAQVQASGLKMMRLVLTELA